MEQLTAQQEAKQLLEKVWSIDERFGSIGFHEAKQIAILVIEGRMEELCILPYGMEYLDRLAYLEEIKEEINKL